MPKKKKETGRGFELIVKAIYEALLQQESVKNLDIRHDVKIQGTSTIHQIDVYWKFDAAQIVYETIVQVKKEKRRASQGEILQFAGVLDDLPGPPRGIFITRAGFQKGAIKVALSKGIILLQLTEFIERPQFTMTLDSFALAELLLDSLKFRVTVFKPNLRNLMLVADRDWVTKNAPALLECPPAPAKIKSHEFQFRTETGEDRGTLASRVIEFIKDFQTGGDLLIEFAEPIFVSTKSFLDQSIDLEWLKVDRISLTVDVTKEVTETGLSSQKLTTYLLTNVLNSTKRFVLVGGDSNSPQATVSLNKLQ
jgi:hypothetical protein